MVADFIAGDAQHLATPPSLNGPGLGIFSCRFNAQKKRSSDNPGRYNRKAQDLNGRDCFVMVLSTREQHIRKEGDLKCLFKSSFPRYLGRGAFHLLLKGNDGIANSLKFALEKKEKFLADITDLEEVDLAFPLSPCFNESVLEFNRDIALKLLRKLTLLIYNWESTYQNESRQK